ncbi:glutamate 5-kinase [bacterium]|nr:glutamate 5-kinase [bacterium]
MRDLGQIKRIIIKIGSSSLIKPNGSPNEDCFDEILKNIKLLKQNNIDSLIVSSGAIAFGINHLKLDSKPQDLSFKQAVAALGQARLMETYNKISLKYNLNCGQILLSHDDFEIRKRMLLLSNTLDEMFKHNIIPIVNENDALAVDEIKVGDNDTLASLLAPMIHADLLVLFSDIDGLYTKNPRKYKDAIKIDEVDYIDENIISMADKSDSKVGTGGMITKIKAALIATKANTSTIICSAKEIKNLSNIINGDDIGTLFKKDKNGISSREHWMIYKTNSKDYSIVVDDGVVDKLKNNKISILPVGIKNVIGDFLAGTVVSILNLDGNLIGKGITNYSSIEIRMMMGRDSKSLKDIIDNGKNEVIHANNLVLRNGELLWN